MLESFSRGIPGLRKIMSRNLRIFAISQSVIGIFLAWLLLHIMYSLHYAKLYYGEIDHNDANAFRKGFSFPGNQDVVDYWDFVYYSFTIAMPTERSMPAVITTRVCAMATAWRPIS